MIGPVNDSTLTSSPGKPSTDVLIRRFSRACLRAADTTTRADHNVSKTTTGQKRAGALRGGNTTSSSPSSRDDDRTQCLGSSETLPGSSVSESEGATAQFVFFLTRLADLETVRPQIETFIGHCVVSTAVSSWSPPLKTMPSRALGMFLGIVEQNNWAILIRRRTRPE